MRSRPSTWRRYEEYARLHTVPTLGRIKLTELTPAHLQRLYTLKLDAGCSPTSVAHLHAMLAGPSIRPTAGGS